MLSDSPTTRSHQTRSPCIGVSLAKLFRDQRGSDLDPRLQHVGRLDEHSCGLLLLTNDGQITKYLIAEGNNIPREYCCVVRGIAYFHDLKRKLENGVESRYGTFFGKLISVRAAFEENFEHEKCCARNSGQTL